MFTISGGNYTNNFQSESVKASNYHSLPSSDKLKVNQSDLPVCFDTDFYHCAHSSYVYTGRKEGKKEGDVLSNDALSTFLFYALA